MLQNSLRQPFDYTTTRDDMSVNLVNWAILLSALLTFPMLS
jgi:hypothetical protein